MAKKSMIIALIISIFFAGLGLLYTKEYVKGIVIFVVFMIFSLLSRFIHPLISIVSLIIWIYGLYVTYQSVKAWNADVIE